jgi:alanine dehydrogenase
MIVGILREIKVEENRVCMTPAGVELMAGSGHTVLVEALAGAGSGFTDEAYRLAKAEIVATPAEIYNYRHGYARQRAPTVRVRHDP